MYVVGNASTFNYVLGATAVDYTGVAWDIAIEEPDGTRTYYNDIPGIVNPIVDTVGSASFTFTPTQAGVHTIILSVGTSTLNSIKHKQLFSVTDVTANTELFVELA